jgi:RNA polymerase sigma factor (TIGR02999 family)
MADITRLLDAAASGDTAAAADLLPLVYDELRKLATARMAAERADHTLQPTALVHEAYLRLVRKDASSQWNGRGHFFAAAAEAMRRILVEQARQKCSLKRGGDRERVKLDRLEAVALQRPDEVLALHEALSKLAMTDPEAAELVKLRYFVGFSVEEAAQTLGISPRSADFLWAYARTWLLKELQG